MTHRTVVEQIDGRVFVWACSCGQYDHRPMLYRLASAGANRHRKQQAPQHTSTGLQGKGK